MPVLHTALFDVKIYIKKRIIKHEAHQTRLSIVNNTTCQICRHMIDKEKSCNVMQLQWDPCEEKTRKER